MLEAAAGHRVEGEVFSVTPETLAALDNYEDLASGEYRRAIILVFDASGHPHRVHVYIYQSPAQELPAIGSRWTTERESPSVPRYP